MDLQKILPVKANWDETVWKGPIDFIAAQAVVKPESHPAQNPEEAVAQARVKVESQPAQNPEEAVKTEPPCAGAATYLNARQRRKHAKELHEVGFAVTLISTISAE